MLIRFCFRVRTWTAVLAFAATWLASPAISRAEQTQQAALSPKMANAFAALVQEPTAANLQTVRGLLAADRSYNPYSDDLTQLSTLLQAGKNREVIALEVKSQPNLLLSPGAHRLAAEAARGIGDKTQAATETAFADRCLDGILATGDGSQSRPFFVARVSDEADLLDAKFKTQINSQTLVFHNGTMHDKILGRDGNTYWFDVKMPLEHVEAARIQSPAAAAPAGTSPPATQGATASTATPSPTHGLEAQATPGPETQATVSAVTGVTALVQRGLEAYRAGQNDAALSALNEAIKLDPHNARIHLDRGNVWYVQEEYAQAISDFCEAIRLDPSCATAYTNRGFAFNTLGVQDQAITDFNAAIRLQANFSRAYNGRGCAFRAMAMLDAAIADFDEAIRLNPNYAAAYENRSLAHAKMGNQALSDADAAKARQLRGLKASPAATSTAKAETPGK